MVPEAATDVQRDASRESGGARTHVDVAVVIPCYNQATFLPAAIESALTQSGPRVQVIVVDDGSTDETATVAGGFDAVRLIRQENAGLPAARNAGLRFCEAPYVAFLDADDVLLAGGLEAGVSHHERHPFAAFVWGRHRFRLSDGSQHTFPQAPSTEHPYAALLRRNFIAMHGAVLYRREVVEAAGGFDARLRACEDYDLYLRLARQHPTFGHDVLVAEYRFHDTNMSSDAALMLRTSLAVLRRQWPYVRGDAALEAAYRDGRRFWRQLFGDQVLEHAIRAVKRGRPAEAARDMAVLLAHAPLRLLQYVRHRLLGSAPPRAG